MRPADPYAAMLRRRRRRGFGEGEGGDRESEFERAGGDFRGVWGVWLRTTTVTWPSPVKCVSEVGAAKVVWDCGCQSVWNCGARGRRFPDEGCSGLLAEQAFKHFLLRGCV